jgi:hypothetical protein
MLHASLSSRKLLKDSLFEFARNFLNMFLPCFNYFRTLCSLRIVRPSFSLACLMPSKFVFDGVSVPPLKAGSSPSSQDYSSSERDYNSDSSSFQGSIFDPYRTLIISACFPILTFFLGEPPSPGHPFSINTLAKAAVRGDVSLPRFFCSFPFTLTLYSLGATQMLILHRISSSMSCSPSFRIYRL